MRLRDGLGVKMVAVMTNKRERTVDGWCDGVTPKSRTEERLREIFKVFNLVYLNDSLQVTRSWFLGTNPNLGYSAPALAIADGRTSDALAAAEDFVFSG